MKTLEDQIKDIEITRGNIKSKVKFSGDFHKELETLLGALEKRVAEQVIKNYRVEYSEYGSASMRIKIKDSDLMIEKLITCNFTFKANDEKFGYVNPQFIVAVKSQKSRIYDLRRYPIGEGENILTDVMKKLLEIIEEY